MYKNKRFNKAIKTKAPLNPIGEDTTIKIPRLDNPPIDKENESNDQNYDKELFSQEALEAIPASQEPTQRYLSQRSTLCRTQSRSTQRPPTTYFELVLIKSGVNLDAADNFMISCDHVSFVCKFREIFVKCQNYPSNVETFKTGLRNALNDKKMAMKLLSGCTINIPGEENPYQSQDSMIVNFLMIDFLQEAVINIILDKVDEISKSETSTSTDVPILPLMLSQLRYVTQSDEGLIYTRIVDIFEAAVQCVQWDIIANAEMFLKSSKHDAFVEMLLNNFASPKDVFHSTTIKTFTNLCLSLKMQTKLRKKALTYIKDDCPPKILPLLVKLMLKILNENGENVMRELVDDLRDVLMREFDCSKPEVEQSLIDIFNYITQGLTRSKTLFDTWQKYIQNLAPVNFRPFFAGFSSGAARLITYPLEVIKLKAQIQQTTGIIALKENFKNGGFSGLKALYRGALGSLGGSLLTTSLRFELYEAAKRHEMIGSLERKMAVASGSGALAGFLATPILKVIVRAQNDCNLSYGAIFDGGFRKMFDGAVTSSLRGTLISMGQLVLYDEAKTFLLRHREDNFYASITASIAAGSVATVLQQPVEVILVTYMSAKPGKFRHCFDASKSVASAYGFKGFYRGLMPGFLRIVPQTVITYVLLEHLRKNYGKVPTTEKSCE